MTTATPDALTTSYALLPVAKLRPAEHNIRFALGDLEDLTASIRARGVQQPLLVAPAPGKAERWTIIAGHRRHAAAKRAGLKQVPCLVDESLTAEADQLEAMLTENGHRADLSPVEEAQAYQLLIDMPDRDVKAAAAATGRSQAFVRGRLKLGRLGADLRDQVHTRQVTLDQALVLAEYADDEDATQRLVRALGTSNWAWVVQYEKQSAEADRRVTRWVKALAKHDVVPAAEAASVEELYDRPDLTLIDDDFIAESFPDSFTDIEQERAAVRGVWDDITRTGRVPWAVYGEALASQEQRAEHPDGLPVVAAGLSTLGDRQYLEVFVENLDDRGPVEDGRLVEDVHLPGDGPAQATTRPGPAAAASPTLTPEQRAAADAARELREQLETAAKVRWDHVLDVVAGGDVQDLAAQFARRELAERLSGNRVDVVVLRRAMGLPADVSTVEEITAAIGSWSLPRLVLAEQATIRLGHTDGDLRHPDRWPGSPTYVGYDYAKDWRAELTTAWGYQWSDVELGLLPDDEREAALAAREDT